MILSSKSSCNTGLLNLSLNSSVLGFLLIDLPLVGLTLPLKGCCLPKVPWGFIVGGLPSHSSLYLKIKPPAVLTAPLKTSAKRNPVIFEALLYELYSANKLPWRSNWRTDLLKFWLNPSGLGPELDNPILWH